MRRFLAAASLLIAGTLAGCDVQPMSPAGPGAPSEARAAKKSSSTSLYTVQFSGDVLSQPVADVKLSSTAPLSNVAIASMPLTLPDLADLTGCGLDGTNWTPYAGNWTGYLALTSDASTATLNFTAYAPDGTPFWLSVSGAATTSTVGSVTTLTFTDIKAMAKMDKEPLIVIFPCTTFSISATKQ